MRIEKKKISRKMRQAINPELVSTPAAIRHDAPPLPLVGRTNIGLRYNLYESRKSWWHHVNVQAQSTRLSLRTALPGDEVGRTTNRKTETRSR